MPWLCDDPGGAGRCVVAVCLYGDGGGAGEGSLLCMRGCAIHRPEKKRPGLAGALVRRQTGLEVLSKGKGTRSLVWVLNA